uniref:Putative secreted peptide n=1 Tax=Anopheles braziliensis TaxID=58242 RepID=A0A2M3ZXC1_9DIPT
MAAKGFPTVLLGLLLFLAPVLCQTGVARARWQMQGPYTPGKAGHDANGFRRSFSSFLVFSLSLSVARSVLFLISGW